MGRVHVSHSKHGVKTKLTASPPITFKKKKKHPYFLRLLSIVNSNDKLT